MRSDMQKGHTILQNLGYLFHFCAKDFQDFKFIKKFCRMQILFLPLMNANFFCFDCEKEYKFKHFICTCITNIRSEGSYMSEHCSDAGGVASFCACSPAGSGCVNAWNVVTHTLQ